MSEFSKLASYQILDPPGTQITDPVAQMKQLLTKPSINMDNMQLLNSPPENAPQIYRGHRKKFGRTYINILHDPRVVRGNTYAAFVIPSSLQMEFLRMKEEEEKRKKLARMPKKVPRCAYIGLKGAGRRDDKNKKFEEEKKEESPILKPIEKPFRALAFNPKTFHISMKIYPDSAIKNLNLDDFSDAYSSYCNTPKNLYISGGKGKASKYFWKINKQNYSPDKLKDLLIPKEEHTMFFVPKKYIYFIGGNSQETFMYNIPKNNFEEWGPLKKKRIKPCVALANKTRLYVFDSQPEKKNVEFVEKCNLAKGRQFELLKVSLSFILVIKSLVIFLFTFSIFFLSFDNFNLSISSSSSSTFFSSSSAQNLLYKSLCRDRDRKSVV